MNTSDKGTYRDHEASIGFSLVRTRLARQDHANQLKWFERKDSRILRRQAIACERWSDFGKGQPLYRRQADSKEYGNDQGEDCEFHLTPRPRPLRGARRIRRG